MKYKIKYVKPSKIKGFYGMNPEASKHFHLKNYPKDTIEIDKKLGRKNRLIVKRHELIECGLMHKGMRYNKADKIATKYERKI